MKTMKAAQKTKPDPMHYKRLADRLIDRRNAMLDRACELEEANADDPEAYSIRRKIDIDLQPRIMSAHRQLCCAQAMTTVYRRVEIMGVVIDAVDVERTNELRERTR